VRHRGCTRRWCHGRSCGRIRDAVCPSIGPRPRHGVSLCRRCCLRCPPTWKVPAWRCRSVEPVDPTAAPSRHAAPSRASLPPPHAVDLLRSAAGSPPPEHGELRRPHEPPRTPRPSRALHVLQPVSLAQPSSSPARRLALEVIERVLPERRPTSARTDPRRPVVVARGPADPQRPCRSLSAHRRHLRAAHSLG
jgi:hypothetical protein